MRFLPQATQASKLGRFHTASPSVCRVFRQALFVPFGYSLSDLHVYISGIYESGTLCPFIRDGDVDALAKRVQKVIEAPNKTEAVRIALQHELDRAQTVLPLRDRIKRFADMGKELGPDDASLDMKKFIDDVWDGI